MLVPRLVGLVKVVQAACLSTPAQELRLRQETVV
jgi:hypothetical protein